MSVPQGFVPPPYPYDRLDALKPLADAHEGGCVDLSIGTPCDPPPAAVIAALGGSNAERGYPASIGSAPYREAASAWLARRFGATVAPKDLAACVGTKEFVALLPQLLHLRNPTRDTILYPAISYPTYAMGATLAGCRSVPVPVDEHWRIRLDAIEPAKIGLHQLIVFFHGARRRIAFAPGRRDHHQSPRFAERWQVEIGKIDNAWLETILARDLGKIAGETFGVPGLAREDDGQRLRRYRRRDRRLRDAGRRFNSGEKPRKPRALPIVGRTDDPVQQLDLFVTERCRLRDIRSAHRHKPWKTALLAFQIEGRFSSAQRSAKNKKKCMFRRAIVSRLFPPDDGARRDWPMPLRGKFGSDLEGIGELIPMPVPPALPSAG